MISKIIKWKKMLSMDTVIPLCYSGMYRNVEHGLAEVHN